LDKNLKLILEQTVTPFYMIHMIMAVVKKNIIHVTKLQLNHCMQHTIMHITFETNADVAAII